MAEDMVNHPKHYEGNTSLECIRVMELFLGRKAVKYFCLGNAFKYLWRYKHKNGRQDVNKARWYMDKYAELAHKSKRDKLSSKFRKLSELLTEVEEEITNETGKN